VSTIAWAVDTYRSRPEAFRAMQQRAMNKRLGWDVAAARYGDVYDWAVAARRGLPQSSG
jgi:starch synthase